MLTRLSILTQSSLVRRVKMICEKYGAILVLIMATSIFAGCYSSIGYHGGHYGYGYGRHHGYRHVSGHRGYHGHHGYRYGSHHGYRRHGYYYRGYR